MPGQIDWIVASEGPVPALPGWQIRRSNAAQWLAQCPTPAVLIVDLLSPQEITALTAKAPHSIRVLTVPDCQDELLLPFLGSFHLFYPQPLPDTALRQLAEIADALQRLALPAHCQAQLLACTHLPVLPPVVQQLQQLLLDPDVRIERLASVIEQDPILSARLLQLANSAYMGFNHDTASLQMAISRLGLGLLYSVLLALCVGPVQQQTADADLLQLVAQCRLIGQWLGLNGNELEQCFVLALFYQLGDTLLQQATGDTDAVSPGQAGAFMLTLWGLPALLCQALLLQSRPVSVVDDRLALSLWLARHRLSGAAPDPALAVVLAQHQLSAQWPAVAEA